ncbi:MAG: hypothetical protein RLW62_07975, partial [Gammaproteobacteria bacterium]
RERLRFDGLREGDHPAMSAAEIGAAESGAPAAAGEPASAPRGNPGQRALMPLEAIAGALEAPAVTPGELLHLGEAVLAHWLLAHGQVPTEATREGFRLLALQRQGAKDDPSFNACRETARELAWHYNLLTQTAPDDAARLREMMRFAAKHLYFFVAGKLEQAGLGDFCCAARPLRQDGH